MIVMVASTVAIMRVTGDAMKDRVVRVRSPRPVPVAKNYLLGTAWRRSTPVATPVRRYSTVDSTNAWIGVTKDLVAR